MGSRFESKFYQCLSHSQVSRVCDRRAGQDKSKEAGRYYNDNLSRLHRLDAGTLEKVEGAGTSYRPNSGGSLL